MIEQHILNLGALCAMFPPNKVIGAFAYGQEEDLDASVLAVSPLIYYVTPPAVSGVTNTARVLCSHTVLALAQVHTKHVPLVPSPITQFSPISPGVQGWDAALRAWLSVLNADSLVGRVLAIEPGWAAEPVRYEFGQLFVGYRITYTSTLRVESICPSGEFSPCAL